MAFDGGPVIYSGATAYNSYRARATRRGREGPGDPRGRSI